MGNIINLIDKAKKIVASIYYVIDIIQPTLNAINGIMGGKSIKITFDDAKQSEATK